MAKVLVSFDDRLLERIDRTATAAGLSRSAYLARLAERDVNGATGPGAAPEVREALARADRLFAEYWTGDEDSTVTIRRMRDSR